MKKLLTALSVFLVFAFGLTSCHKDSIETSHSTVHHLLTAKTWQVEEVALYKQGTLQEVEYKRGASTNSVDYSKMRNTYLENGTLQSIDEEGEPISGLRWKLVDDDKKLEVSYGNITVTAFDLQVTRDQLSCKVGDPGGEYERYVYTPIP